jgi:large exoprotein involved in heme utilization and adhesion
MQIGGNAVGTIDMDSSVKNSYLAGRFIELDANNGSTGRGSRIASKAHALRSAQLKVSHSVVENEIACALLQAVKAEGAVGRNATDSAIRKLELGASIVACLHAETVKERRVGFGLVGDGLAGVQDPDLALDGAKADGAILDLILVCILGLAGSSILSLN